MDAYSGRGGGAGPRGRGRALVSLSLTVVFAVAATVILLPAAGDAVVANAPTIILVHNHPSGDPEASPDDIQLTKDAAQAAKLLSIELLDHVIVGQGRFVSLKERGVL